MRERRVSLGTLCGLALALFLVRPAAGQSLAELQTHFDRENNSVHKARLLEKLGDAQFEVTRQASKAGDHATVALTFEKYRDNARAALQLLKKQHPDAERQSNGYRQLQFHVRRAIREVDESLLMAADEFKPPLQLVRADLIRMDDEMIMLLFPGHPQKPAKTPSPTEKQL
jgi:hypothetical protein